MTIPRLHLLFRVVSIYGEKTAIAIVRYLSSIYLLYTSGVFSTSFSLPARLSAINNYLLSYIPQGSHEQIRWHLFHQNSQISLEVLASLMKWIPHYSPIAISIKGVTLGESSSPGPKMRKGHD